MTKSFQNTNIAINSFLFLELSAGFEFINDFLPQLILSKTKWISYIVRAMLPSLEEDIRSCNASNHFFPKLFTERWPKLIRIITYRLDLFYYFLVEVVVCLSYHVDILDKVVNQIIVSGLV